MQLQVIASKMQAEFTVCQDFFFCPGVSVIDVTVGDKNDSFCYGV